MIKAKLVLPDLSATHVTPDWLENDSESLSYIKNRTHYVETINESLFAYPRLFGPTETFVDMGEVSFDLAVGDVYTFKYGVDVENAFQCVAKYSISLENTFLGSDSVPLSEDCPFAAYVQNGHLFVASRESQPLGFSLEHTESVKRLDLKYLPEYLLPSGYHSNNDVLGLKENGEVGWVKYPGNKVCHFESYQDLPEQADNGLIAIIDSETRLTGAIVSRVLVPKNTYRLPTAQEFNYILNQREEFTERQFRATITGVTEKDIKGYVLLPDNFNLDLLVGLEDDSYGKVLDASTFYTFNSLGLVFLPCAGNLRVNRNSLQDVDINGWYWTSTFEGFGRAFMNTLDEGVSYYDNWYTNRPLSVRLVQDCEEHDFGAIRSGGSSWVRFTNGNLRYEESTQVWSIARESWMYLGEKNIQSYKEKVGLVDYFTFGSSGYNDRTPDVNADLNIDIAGTEYDFGVHNDIYDYLVVEGVRVYKPESAFIYSEDTHKWEPLSGYDTLEELELPRRVESVENVLPTKVDKIEGKGLSTNDFTDAYKSKLDNITNPIQLQGRVDSVADLPTSGVDIGWAYLVGPEGSENFEEYVCVAVDGQGVPSWENLGHVRVQVDWNQNDPTKDDYIKHRICWEEEYGVAFDSTMSYEKVYTDVSLDDGGFVDSYNEVYAKFEVPQDYTIQDLMGRIFIDGEGSELIIDDYIEEEEGWYSLWDNNSEQVGLFIDSTYVDPHSGTSEDPYFFYTIDESDRATNIPATMGLCVYLGTQETGEISSFSIPKPIRYYTIKKEYLPKVEWKDIADPLLGVEYQVWDTKQVEDFTQNDNIYTTTLEEESGFWWMIRVNTYYRGSVYPESSYFNLVWVKNGVILEEWESGATPTYGNLYLMDNTFEDDGGNICIYMNGENEWVMIKREVEEGEMEWVTYFSIEQIGDVLELPNVVIPSYISRTPLISDLDYIVQDIESIE